MKHIIFIFGTLFFLNSCNTNNDGYKISGKINGAKGKVIYLASSNQTDSVKINDDNTFEFNGKITEPDFFNLYFNQTNPILLFVDSIDKINVEADASNFAQNYKVTGSVTSEQIMQLQQKLNNTFNKVQKRIRF